MFLFALFDERIEIVEALEMDCRATAPAYRLPKPLGVMGLLILCMMIFPSSADASESWLCEETAYYSIYEDVARLEGQTKQNAKILQWIDKDTIGLESTTHKRSRPKSDTFIDHNTGGLIYINDKETPHIVILTKPQTWMNKFGHLRVQFYRCSP